MLVKFLVMLIIVFVIDMIWIKSVAQNKYQSLIAKIQKSPMVVNTTYAVLSYIIIAIFVLFLEQKNFNHTEMFIAGLLAYGIYDLTCAAIFSDWDLWFGVADMIWGGILFTSSAYVFRRIM